MIPPASSIVVSPWWDLDIAAFQLWTLGSFPRRSPAHDRAALSGERQVTDMEVAVRKLFQWKRERRAAACSGRCDATIPPRRFSAVQQGHEMTLDRCSLNTNQNVIFLQKKLILLIRSVVWLSGFNALNLYRKFRFINTFTLIFINTGYDFLNTKQKPPFQFFGKTREYFGRTKHVIWNGRLERRHPTTLV